MENAQWISLSDQKSKISITHHDFSRRCPVFSMYVNADILDRIFSQVALEFDINSKPDPIIFKQLDALRPGGKGCPFFF